MVGVIPEVGQHLAAGVTHEFILDDTGKPAAINRLLGGPIASARVWFDEWVGVEASMLDPDVIDRLRPEVYRRLTQESDETLFMKVHDAFVHVGGEPMFPADATCGVVYIIRNPLDVAVSCAHHWGWSVESVVETMCASSPKDTTASEASLRAQGLADQLRQRLGSWSEHVCSWIDDSRLPIHVIRYEDMHADPFAVFGGVVRFCGLHYDDTRMQNAVVFSSFEVVQRQEASGGFEERSVSGTGPFFRRGLVDSSRDELGPNLTERLITAHHNTMTRFGYDT